MKKCNYYFKDGIIIFKIYDKENNTLLVKPKNSYIYGKEVAHHRLYIQNYHKKVYKTIAEWMVKKGIKSVGGPVLGGGIISYQISLFSNCKIRHFYLPKINNLYRTHRHLSDPQIQTPYAVVDDIVTSGESLRYGINTCVNKSNCEPKIILIFNGPSMKISKKILNKIYKPLVDFENYNSVVI